MRPPLLALLAALLAAPQAARAENLVSPQLHLAPSPIPRVALTLDACSGHTDNRILDALIANNIKSTIFVTARWLRRNPETLARMLARRDLFEIENHGAEHVFAAPWPAKLFGVKSAGSAAALKAEIEGGAAAIKAATGRTPHWYRAAVAEYAESALPLIRSLDVKIAGYSLAGDGGAQYSEQWTAHVISHARPGDVILAHINQPSRPAGAGVVEGVLALKAQGVQFVWLDEAAAHMPRRVMVH
ncbi:MAG: polysaccharide deacetylase family protein [Hyphomicrobiales bacterium]